MCFDYDIGCVIMRKTRKNPVKKLRISFLFIHCEKKRSIGVWGEQDLAPPHITVPLTEPNLNMTAYLWYLRPYSKHYFSPLFSALGHPILPDLFKFMNLEVLNKANYSSSCRTGTYFFLPWVHSKKVYFATNARMNNSYMPDIQNVNCYTFFKISRIITF